MKFRATVDLTPHKDQAKSAINERAARLSWGVVPPTRVYEYAVKRAAVEAGYTPAFLVTEATSKGVPLPALLSGIERKSDEALQRLAAIEADRKRMTEAVGACKSLPEIHALRAEWGI